MVTFAQLLLPLLASAVLVFIASSLIHMVLRWHASDYRELPNEDEVAAALRRSGVGSGQYQLPYCKDMKQMQTPEMQQKLREGPQGLLVLRPAGMPSMGKPLALWFGVTVFVSGVAGCILATTLGPGAAASQVFHIAALIAFAAYGTGSVVDAIWFARPWVAVAKDLLDSLIYAGITGASYALLWPSGAVM